MTSHVASCVTECIAMTEAVLSLLWPVSVSRSLESHLDWRFGKPPTEPLIPCLLQLSLIGRYERCDWFSVHLYIELLLLQNGLPPLHTHMHGAYRCSVCMGGFPSLFLGMALSHPSMTSLPTCQTPWNRAHWPGTSCGTTQLGKDRGQMTIM